MKKSNNFILIIIFTIFLNACSVNLDNSSSDLDNSQDFNAFFNELLLELELTYHNVCTNVEDAINRPEPWNVDVANNFTISDETIHSMSTCGLLDTYLTFPSYPDPNGGDFYNSAISQFNSNLRENKVALELFERSDFFPVLASKFLTLIKKNQKDIGSGQIEDLEWFLSSDLCLSLLDEKGKNQIMAMALANEETDRNKYIIPCLSKTYQVMIAIMLWCNYDPFIKEVGPRIREGAVGYYLMKPEDEMTGNCLSYPDAELILKYAKNFLYNQNL